MSVLGPLSDEGHVISETWLNGLGMVLTGEGAFLRHLRHRMEEARAYTRADRSKRHADWYCSLSWPRMWWALVTGR